MSLLFVAWDRAANAQDEPPRVITQISTSRVYEGQPIVYRVIVRRSGDRSGSGALAKPGSPQLGGFDDFDVRFVTEKKSEHQIINGAQPIVRRVDHEYVYQLVPRKTGRLVIPSPTVKIGNTEFRGESLGLSVIPAAEQDVVILNVHTDRDEVFRAQPFAISLTIRIKSLPSPLADRNPLALSAGERNRFSLFRRRQQIRPPQLKIMWFDDEGIPTGLTPEKSWRDELLPLRSSESIGFRVNNIGTQFALAVFDEADVAFMPRPSKVQRKDDDGKPRDYWQFNFTRTFIGQRVGRYDFAPATLQGTFATGVSGGNLVGESIFAVSNPISVSVREIPTQGRPANYMNAIGNFELVSQLTPNSANVGDPLTLTLTLRGVGTLEEATPPDLAAVPEIVEHFRLHAPSSEMHDGERVFTYAIRPLSTDTHEFPAISAAYFDVERETYIELVTPPIPLQIAAAQHLNSTDIVAAPNSRPGVTDIELSEDGVFGNITDLDGIRHDRVQPRRWFVGWSGMLGAYALAWVLLGRFQSLQADPARVTRRRAISLATERLDDARKLAAAGMRLESIKALREAFVGCVADVTNEPAASLTPRELQQKLVTLGVDHQLSGEIGELLERCQVGQYADASEWTTAEIATAERLLRRLTESLKECGLLP